MSNKQSEPITDGGQPLDREHYQFLSNAGRCDICGEPVDMKDAGHTLTISEFGVDDEITEKHGTTDQDAADAVADALEAVADSGADYDLAKTIREQMAFVVHDDCLEDTNYSKLTAAVPDGTEVEDVG